MVTMETVSLKLCRVIIMFGPATDVSGTKAGEYYQVTIDPDFLSPSGDYIRFGMTGGDEIQGWQRVESMTVCEILEELPDSGETTVNIRKVV